MAKHNEVNKIDPAYLYDQSLAGIPDSIDLDKWQRMVNLLASIFKAPAATINKAQGKSVDVLIASCSAKNPYQPGDSASGDINVYCHQVIRSKSPLYVRNAAGDSQWSNNPEFTQDGFVSYLGMPLLWPDGSVFGTLCVFDTIETEYRDNLKEFLQLLREMIENDLRYLKLTKDLKLISIKDELTGLNNRRGFMEYAKSFVSSSRRHHQFIALFYFDLDNLKLINDQHGHEAGDLYIKSFAQALINSIRVEDIAARLGGDEFVMMTQANRSVNCEVIKQRIENDFKARLANIPQFSGASFSVGSKVFAPVGNITIDSMLSETDALMYEQKKAKK